MGDRITEQWLSEVEADIPNAYAVGNALARRLIAEIRSLRAERDEYRAALRKQYLWSVYQAAYWIADHNNPAWPNVPHDHACMSDGEFAADLFIRLGLADPAPRGMTPRPEMWEAMGEISEEMERALLAEEGEAEHG